MRRLLRLQHLMTLEAALVGVFFVQALRLLIGLLYSRVASAGLVSTLDPASIEPGIAGVVTSATVSSEISFLVYMLALPLLAVILGRVKWLIVVAAIIAAVGRALMVADTSVSQAVAASLTVGGALLYIAMIVRHRAQVLPYLFIIGFGVDQVLRAMGNTMDVSWGRPYYAYQVILSIAVVGLSLITTYRSQSNREADVSPDYGLLPFWGGVGLGGLLFLELALLALPNAIAGRADWDYTILVPLTLATTLLPLVPWVRVTARNFVSTFDGDVRGWLWMLLVALLVVFGTRFQGTIAAIVLVVAQFAVSMMWWWLVRPQAEQERKRNFSGLWLIVSSLILLLLIAGDSFTYEYAYVRDLAPQFSSLNQVVPPLLRGFRGLGLGVLLLAVFLAALPMTQTRKRVPWPSGTFAQTMLGIVVIAAAAYGAGFAARPPLIAGVRNVETIRIGTYNIHAGFNEFFNYSLEDIARTIESSGANVVLVQEIEAGRLSSFGVDQSLWLARRLGMDTRFYPTNEGLQGLAVLSNIEIVYDDGRLLSSTGQQTGVQRVQVKPDAGVITVYNTWLGLLLQSAEGIADQEQDQERQLNEIFSIIAGDHPGGNLGRIVIGGTFNNTPTSPLIQEMRDIGFLDPFAGLPIELSGTLWRTGLRARLDYLWIRPPLLATSAIAIDTHASDHRMAVIEVQIAR